jgi:hypothetical protein
VKVGEIPHCGLGALRIRGSSPWRSMDELDRWSSAHLLIEARGARAADHAADRARELALVGDIAGAWEWLGITEAIEELERARPHEGEFTN